MTCPVQEKFSVFNGTIRDRPNIFREQTAIIPRTLKLNTGAHGGHFCAVHFGSVGKMIMFATERIIGQNKTESTLRDTDYDTTKHKQTPRKKKNR
jgi:hypothetical protein